MADPRIPVYIGEYKVKVKVKESSTGGGGSGSGGSGSGGSGGGSSGTTTELQTRKAIARVVKRVFTELSLTEAKAEDLKGKEVDSETNGKYSAALTGSVGAKHMVLISSSKGSKGKTKTYRMSIPHACPNHIFVAWVQDKLSSKVKAVISPRGKRYLITSNTSSSGGSGSGSSN